MTGVAAQVQFERDRSLLDRFLHERSNETFEQLVRRHVDLVYATSLRRVRDRHLAEDVTQAVFLVLWQRGHTIKTPLPAWLHRTTCYASSNTIKMQTRRTHHEQQAAAQRLTATANDWMQIEPELDDALDRLSSVDRAAVLLRYHESASIEQTARALNLSIEATKKRLQRALVKLRAILSNKGIALSLVALIGALEANASVVAAAPETLATSATAAVATTASVKSSVITSISKGVAIMLIRDQLRTVAIWFAASLLVIGGIGATLPRLIGRTVKQHVSVAASEPTIQFGAIVELTVNDDGLHKDECIDFDKGITVSGPQGGFANREEGAKWFRQSGADCHAETQTGEAGLYPVQMIALLADQDEWHTLTAEQLVDLMNRGQPPRDWISAEGDLPVTFSFKTREGAIGIAQITEMNRGNEEHGTLRVRFKLVK